MLPLLVRVSQQLLGAACEDLGDGEDELDLEDALQIVDVVFGDESDELYHLLVEPDQHCKTDQLFQALLR